MSLSCRRDFFPADFSTLKGLGGIMDRRRGLSVFFTIFLINLLSTASLAAERKAWTILFFIAGDEEGIDPWSRVPLRKLEQFGSDANRWIVAHTDFHWNNEGSSPVTEPARRYLIEKHPGKIDGHDFSTLAIASPEIWQSSGETDSSARGTLHDFIGWAIERYPADHYALFVLGHSWGWRGIGEDYNPGFKLPENPGGPAIESTMASLKEMRAALTPYFSAERPLELLVLDACNDGVLEVAYEFRDLARAFSAAPTEMPYLSYDYTRSFQRPWRDGKELARALVLDAVPTYGRGGSQVVAEREYPSLAITAVDLEKLRKFWPAWKELTERLPSSNFHELFLGARAASWMDNSWNIDVSELLSELSLRSSDGEVRTRAQALNRNLVGENFPPAYDEVWRVLKAEGADRIRVTMRADELLPPDRTLSRTRESFDFMNPHLRTVEKTVSLVGAAPELWAVIEFGWKGADLRIRPFIPGGTRAIVETLRAGKVMRYLMLNHPSGIGLRSDYPATSPYLANGHTFGMGRNHGLTVNLDSLVDPALPAHHHFGEQGWESGKAMYRALSFAKEFGWDRLLYSSPVEGLKTLPAYRNRGLRRSAPSP